MTAIWPGLDRAAVDVALALAARGTLASAAPERPILDRAMTPALTKVSRRRSTKEGAQRVNAPGINPPDHRAVAVRE